MGVFTKLFTAIRGGVNEVGEAIVDSNDVRILEQQLRETEQELRDGEGKLTAVMAEEDLARKEIEALETKYAGYEANAIEALNAGKEDLATQVAERMKEINDDLEGRRSYYEQLKQSVVDMKHLHDQNRKNIDVMKREIKALKAQKTLNKASAALTDVNSGTSSKLAEMNETLKRSKAKAALDSSQIKAAEKLSNERSGKSLDDSLKEAGIGSASTDDLLASLKAKAKK